MDGRFRRGSVTSPPQVLSIRAKRDYLQGKRGIEKPYFQLPSYIADTGIATQRDAIKEKEANMSLKAKTRTRERVQPKMGKIDIDCPRCVLQISDKARHASQRSESCVTYLHCYLPALDRLGLLKPLSVPMMCLGIFILAFPKYKISQLSPPSFCWIFLMAYEAN
jgi:hypothetical protein